MSNVLAVTTASGTLAVTDDVANITYNAGAVTINLPAIASVPSGKAFIIFKNHTGAFAITVDPNAAELIEGAATLAVLSSSDHGRCVIIRSNGTSWGVSKVYPAAVAAYSWLAGDDTLIVPYMTAAFTITLPPVANMQNRTMCVVKANADPYAITLDGYSAETIDGAATIVAASAADTYDRTYITGASSTNWKSSNAVMSGARTQNVTAASATGGFAVEIINCDSRDVAEGGSGANITLTLPKALTAETLASLSGNGTTVTATWSVAHGIPVGETRSVVIAGATGGTGTFNGTFTVTATTTTAATYAASGSGAPTGATATLNQTRKQLRITHTLTGASAKTLTVNRAGTDTITNRTGSAQTSFTISPGRSVNLVCTAAGTWVDTEKDVSDITTTTTLTTQTVVRVDATSGNITLTLPTIGATARNITIIRKDTTTNTVTVSRAGSDTIDGGTSKVLYLQETLNLSAAANSAAWYSNKRNRPKRTITTSQAVASDEIVTCATAALTATLPTGTAASKPIDINTTQTLLVAPPSGGRIYLSTGPLAVNATYSMAANTSATFSYSTALAGWVKV